MLKMLRNKKGFTMVELMVVAIIVAILAAVAIPLMSGNKKRAMATEAEAGLGTIRTALRAVFAETNDYTNNPNSASPITTGAVIPNVPGVIVNDLNGRYFEDDDYTITAITTNTYTIQAVGDTAGFAPRGSDVNGVTLTMDHNGDITRSGL